MVDTKGINTEELKKIILNGILEKKNILLLFIKSCIVVSQLTSDNYKFSNQVCKNLKEIYGKEKLYELIEDKWGD